MQPVDIPQYVKAMYPKLELHMIGSPEGVPEDECGTVPALAGQVDGGFADGYPVFRTIWELTDEEKQQLMEGGVIQLFFYSSGMPPHGMMVMKEEM